MNSNEHRCLFLINFFNKYQDIQSDLKMRIFPLTHFNNKYCIEWIDYTYNKILLLSEQAINEKYKDFKNGLLNYFLDSNNNFLTLKLHFINTYQTIDFFTDIFYKYFDKNSYHKDIETFIKNKISTIETPS